jgi:hypothetical protein
VFLSIAPFAKVVQEFDADNYPYTDPNVKALYATRELYEKVMNKAFEISDPNTPATELPPQGSWLTNKVVLEILRQYERQEPGGKPVLPVN